MSPRELQAFFEKTPEHLRYFWKPFWKFLGFILERGHFFRYGEKGFGWRIGRLQLRTDAMGTPVLWMIKPRPGGDVALYWMSVPLMEALYEEGRLKVLHEDRLAKLRECFKPCFPCGGKREVITHFLDDIGRPNCIGIGCPVCVSQVDWSYLLEALPPFQGGDWVHQ